MDRITSRKNEYIQFLKNFEGEELLCCGMKMLDEALKSNAEITSILWKEDKIQDINCKKQYTAPADLFDYVSPKKNSPGPIFTAIPNIEDRPVKNAIILENVQDPGNVGTVIRTANAMDIDCVYLFGDCASLHNPKTISATMGAVFYQKVLVNCLPELPIYGASLSQKSVNITDTDVGNCAIAIGSEGRGLSAEMLGRCEKEIVIPMTERAESLNAAIAASICMWEMYQSKNFVDNKNL